MKGYTPEVVVVGVGGAGVNAVTRLRDIGLPGVRLVAMDTSRQALARADGACETLLLGAPGRGWGTGGDAGLGAALARFAGPEARSVLAGADLVCVVGGMAGGTGGGAGPEIARLARAAGAVVVGFGIMPFPFETRRHVCAADAALEALRAACDTTVTLDNRRALDVAGGRVPLDIALRVADDVVRQALQGLGAMIAGGGWIPVDWPAVRSGLADGGAGCLALGIGRGPFPARAAMRAALASPLADMRAVRQARALLVHVGGGADLALADAADAIGDLRAQLAPDCRLIVGAREDPALAGAAQVVLLGTGLPSAVASRALRLTDHGDAAPWRAVAAYQPWLTGRNERTRRRAPLSLPIEPFDDAEPLREVV